MANLKAIRSRIGSVKNTQKITKAMKMVAAARLRRAQQAITELRPYAVKTMEVLSSVAARAGDDDVGGILELVHDRVRGLRHDRRGLGQRLGVPVGVDLQPEQLAARSVPQADQPERAGLVRRGAQHDLGDAIVVGGDLPP